MIYFEIIFIFISMRKEFLLILFICIINLSLVDSRKKKKKSKTETTTTANPIDKRPDIITPEHYCDVCIAVVKEMTKELRGKKKESDVFFVLDNVCNPELYNNYRNYLITYR
jgi:hypothetical protein